MTVRARMQKKGIELFSNAYWWLLLFLLVLAAYALLKASFRPVEYFIEDVSFALNSTGQHAYDIGNLHFNGEDPAHYDYARASKYLRIAEQLDPSLLNIHHQMARIYFLRADFGDALSEIDTQIAEHGSTTANSYYVRGLIEGYVGDYTSSAQDYAQFLKTDPHNWAAINDYSWVLLKAGRAKDAKMATDEGLKYWPTNAWLLNSNAIALYELGDYRNAEIKERAAWAQVQEVQEKDWLHSYPGNDPAVAGLGMETFRSSIKENMHRIALAIASSTVQ